MKKLLYSVILLVAFYNSSFAQNWQCLQYGPKHYFINGNNYLRGIRIDSVQTDGANTIYYPYKTARKLDYPESTIAGNVAGSWLGCKVIEEPDGIFLFDNMWNDTVVIKTLANVGDTWPFFNDTSQISYTATVTSLGTMVVLGAMDSVKTITITADSGGISNPLDPVNNFQLILSKNNGFVQVCDLYTFLTIDRTA